MTATPLPDGSESTRMSRKLPVAKRLLTELCTLRIDSGSPAFTVTYLLKAAVSVAESERNPTLVTMAPAGAATIVVVIAIGGGGGALSAGAVNEVIIRSGLRPRVPQAQCPS